MNYLPQRSGESLVEAYVGDPDTGLLHRVHSACGVSSGVFYLNWRTALVHGYTVCHCCRAHAATELITLPGGI